MYSAHSLSYCLSFALLLSNVALPRSRSLTYQITECWCLCKCEHLFGLHTRKHHSSLVHCLHFFARISVCACPFEHTYIHSSRLFVQNILCWCNIALHKLHAHNVCRFDSCVFRFHFVFFVAAIISFISSFLFFGVYVSFA